ncbi:MAG: radical SAM protein [Eubacteriales bacterium]|nr:radical SAM protein [Eubacteriales bacterium]
MYIIPGYIRYKEENGVLFVSSDLLHNVIKLTDTALQAEFCELIKSGGCADLSTPLTQFLHAQELLLTKAEIDQSLETVKALMDDVLMLTIMPTEGCNFRCPYCYEDHTPHHMTRKLLDRLKDFIQEQAPKFKVVRVNWFGGEPTLCQDNVLEIAYLIQSLQSVHQFYYSSSMTTNGYLLDRKHFDQLYASGIKCFHITLDGWNHDHTRPHVSGAGTLQHILDNLISISELPQNEYDFKVIIRHNILAGDMDFSWYDHLYHLFGKDPRFSLTVRTVNDWGGESVMNLDLVQGEKKISLPQLHEEYLDKIGMKRECENSEMFARICYAAYPNGYVFRANGEIVKCSVALDHPRNLVGHLDPQNGVSVDSVANQLWYQNELRPECYTCPDVLSCFNMQCKRYAVIDNQEPYCHRTDF